MKRRLLEDLGPALQDASRVARNAAILSEMAVEQMSRVEATISGAMERVDGIRDTVAYQMDRLATLAAVARSVGRGIATLRGRRAGR